MRDLIAPVYANLDGAHHSARRARMGVASSNGGDEPTLCRPSDVAIAEVAPARGLGYAVAVARLTHDMMGSVRALQRLLALMAPILVPSWRFFDAIGPGLRLQSAPCDANGEPRGPWVDLLKAPAERSWLQIVTGLVFNPVRNDVLYLSACCERVADDGDRFAFDAIEARVLARGRAGGRTDASEPQRFRILRVSREGDRLSETLAFESDVLGRDDVGTSS